MHTPVCPIFPFINVGTGSKDQNGYNKRYLAAGWRSVQPGQANDSRQQLAYTFQLLFGTNMEMLPDEAFVFENEENIFAFHDISNVVGLTGSDADASVAR